MKTVSDAYKESMNSLLRERSYARILFRNYREDAERHTEFRNSPNLVSWSEGLSLFNDKARPTVTNATLELNRWTLDGTNVVDGSADESDGVVFNVVSNERGLFTSNPKLSIRLWCTFSDDPSIGTTVTPIDVVGLTFDFFSKLSNEYPKKINIDCYYDTSDDFERIAHISVLPYAYHQPMSSGLIQADRKIEGFNRIEIEFAQTLPYRRPRLMHMGLGMVYEFTNDDITNVSIHNDVDPYSRRLPDQTAEFSVVDYDGIFAPDNPSGVYDYVDSGGRFSIQFGYHVPNSAIEWLDAEYYFLDSKPEHENNIATFHGIKRLNYMTDTYRTAKFIGNATDNSTFAENAIALLLAYGYEPTEVIGDYSYFDEAVIDGYMYDYVTKAALPLVSFAEAIQILGNACICTVYTDKDNRVMFKRFDVDYLEDDQTDFYIDFNSIEKDTMKASSIPKLKDVIASYYSVKVASSQSEIFSGAVSLDSVTGFYELNYEGSDQFVNASLSSPALSPIEYVLNGYANGFDLLFYGDITSATVVGNAVTYKKKTVTASNGTTGENDYEDNPMFTGKAIAREYANAIKAYLNKRLTYQFDYRGNPELEVGDVIYIQTPYKRKASALVLASDLTFNGSLHGSLIVKILD